MLATERRAYRRYRSDGWRVQRLMRRRQNPACREAAQRMANLTLILWSALVAVGVLLVLSVVR
jgi:hypothetical protein